MYNKCNLWTVIVSYPSETIKVSSNASCPLEIIMEIPYIIFHPISCFIKQPPILYFHYGENYWENWKISQLASAERNKQVCAAAGASSLQISCAPYTQGFRQDLGNWACKKKKMGVYNFGSLHSQFNHFHFCLICSPNFFYLAQLLNIL